MADISLEIILFKIQGLGDIKDYFNDINIYTPLEYPRKIDNLLFDKRLKKINVVAIHEAREVVKAKLWQSFLSQSVADINAMSRSIKRLVVFITSQFIRDITTDVRYTLNYYIIVRRPKRQRARLYINVMWKDDRDLEKPKLRKSKLSGYLVYPNGVYKRYVPQYLELKKPPKELVDIFEKQDFDAKAGIIRGKINRLMRDMEAEIGTESKKVDNMVLWYTSHPENLNLIGKRYTNKWKMKSEVMTMHDLTKQEAIRFEKLINEKLKEHKIIEEVVDNGE
jgi:hypothetical protein